MGALRRVVTLHLSDECNLNCPMCYRKKEKGENNLPFPFFIDMVPYLAEVTEQVACLHPDELVFIVDVKKKSIYTTKVKLLNGCGEVLLGMDEMNAVEEKIRKKSGETLYEVCCTKGRIFRATENHLILTKKGLVKVKELKLGDEVIIQKIKVKHTLHIVDLFEIVQEMGYNSRIGDNNEIIIERWGYRLPAKLKITPRLARLAGFYTSEGDSRYFSLGREETLLIKTIKTDLLKVFDYKTREENNNKSSIKLGMPKLLGKIVFQQALNLGSGARNKKVGSAFFFSKQNILYFLQGLLAGDGNIRIRKKGCSVELKTASKELAEEMRLLYESRLGVTCSVRHGISKPSYIEGNRLLPERDYYQISVYGDRNFKKLLPALRLMKNYKNLLKWLDRKKGKTSSDTLHQKDKVISINPLGRNKEVIDLKLKNPPHIFRINGNILVHNCGGGELYYACPEFVEEFSKACDEHGLICNITTNGTLPDRIIKHSKYITMASVSFDRYKVKNLREHMLLLHKLRESGLRIGTNLLIDNEMFKPPAKFAKLVDLLFMESERVFALYPKNWEFVPILDYRDYYLYLSLRYKHFYVDDTTSKILTEKRYDNWRTSCHIARDAININNDGSVTGCSFSDKVLMRLEEPRDVLKIKDVEAEEIHSCPYITVP